MADVPRLGEGDGAFGTGLGDWGPRLRAPKLTCKSCASSLKDTKHKTAPDITPVLPPFIKSVPPNTSFHRDYFMWEGSV